MFAESEIDLAAGGGARFVTGPERLAFAGAFPVSTRAPDIGRTFNLLDGSEASFGRH